MKKRLLCMLLCLCLTAAILPAVLADSFEVDAKAAILIDLDTGEVLFETNADTPIYPASLTKIMTVLLAIENGDPDDLVTASAEAVTGLDPDGTSVWLSAGEVMSLKDLWYCMMLASANDACNVVAEYISGSIPAFVELMNQRAAELGCTNTHFSNTNGLPDTEHTTTARDLSIIARYAIENETFWEICTTTQYTVPETNMLEARVLATTNSLTTTYKSDTYYDARVQGVKTGYTNDAGRCLIVTAREDGMRLLSVVCGAPDQVTHNGESWYGHYAITEDLLNHGFALLRGDPETVDSEAESPAGEVSDPAADMSPEAETADASESVDALADPAGTEEPQVTYPDIGPETQIPETIPAAAETAPSTDPSDEAVEIVSEETDAKGFLWPAVVLLILGVILEICMVYLLIRRKREQKQTKRPGSRR